MTNPVRVIIFVKGGVAEVEMTDGPVEIAIVDFDCDEAPCRDEVTNVDGKPAEADIYEFNPSPHEDEEKFDQLWGQAQVAAGWEVE